MRNNDFDSDENEAPLKSVRTSRREHRSRRIDVMRELESGVVDERPIKERFSREFKKAKIKRIKNPVENIGEENCVEGLVLEVHRRTCEVRLDERTPAAAGYRLETKDNNQNENALSSLVSPLSSTVTAMYRATTSKTLGEFPAVGDRVLLGLVNDADDEGCLATRAQNGVGSSHYLKTIGNAG